MKHDVHTYQLSLLLLLIFRMVLCLQGGDSIYYNQSVKVFHYIIHHWGESRFGLQDCGNIRCEWFHSSNAKHLRENFLHTNVSEHGMHTITVALYNIHYLWEKVRDTKPAACELNTELMMAESEETRIRYAQLFDQSFKNFDGYSTTHTSSHVPRVYIEAVLNDTRFLPLRNFSSLVKGGSYVASDCHRRDSANLNRDSVVHQIRLNGFRVDGLGRCMHSGTGPEGISLPKTRDTRYNLHLKREVIGKFLFNMAFENSLEPGYVTEKPFDALVSGTVPVYLGDSAHLKYLLPEPSAAIHVSDFQNISALVDYLKYLSTNETAYEQHRSWRSRFTFEGNVRNKPILKTSWFCRVCQWAAEAAHTKKKKPRVCPLIFEGNNNSSLLLQQSQASKVLAPAEWEGKAIKGDQKHIYYVKDLTLHWIPDVSTFLSLKLDFAHVMEVSDEELSKYQMGEHVKHVGGFQ